MTERAMDAIGPFVVIDALETSAPYTRRVLARQVFDDDIGGLVEVACTELGARALLEADASARAATDLDTVPSTLVLAEHEGTAYEVVEHVPARSVATLVQNLSTTADATTFARAIAASMVIAEGLASLHEASRALGFFDASALGITPDGRVTFRRLVPVDGPAPGAAEEESLAARDALVLGRALRALLSGTLDESGRPRVPAKHRPPMRALLLGLLAARPSMRPRLEEAGAALGAILADVDARTPAKIVVEFVAEGRAMRRDDAPDDGLVSSLRTACREVSSPPRPFLARVTKAASQSDRHRATSTDARAEPSRSSSRDVPKTAVARPRRTSDERRVFPAHSADDDRQSLDDGLVFDDVGSGPTRRPPLAVGAPTTEVTTAVVARSDIATAQGFDAPKTGVDDESEARSSSSHASALASATGEIVPGALTLAALAPAELDLHVDEAIVLGQANAPQRAEADDEPPATASHAHAAVPAASPSVDAQATHMGAVWASVSAELEEPETRFDRKRPSAPPRALDVEATVALEVPIRGSSSASVFESSGRHGAAPGATLHDDGAERTMLLGAASLDESVDERAQRTDARARDGRHHALIDDGRDDLVPARPSIVVDERAVTSDVEPDRTALLSGRPADVERSELGSSPFPRAPRDDDETLHIEGPAAAAVIRAALARQPEPEEHTAFLDDAIHDAPPLFTARGEERAGEARADEPLRTAARGDTGVLVVEAPRGADVYVDGKLVGRGHVEVSGVDRFRTLNVRVLLAGHRPWVAEVSLSGRREAHVKPSPARR